MLFLRVDLTVSGEYVFPNGDHVLEIAHCTSGPNRSPGWTLAMQCGVARVAKRTSVRTIVAKRVSPLHFLGGHGRGL